jgi:hypothetical protein
MGLAVTRHAQGDEALCHAGCLKSESNYRAIAGHAMASSSFACRADNRGSSRGENAVSESHPTACNARAGTRAVIALSVLLISCI